MTKADLRRYSFLDAEVRQLERMMREASLFEGGPLTLSYSDMPASGSWENRQAAVGAKYDELSHQYEDMRRELLDMRKRFESYIATWEPEARIIFRMVYFERKKWAQVARELYCSERTAQRVLNREMGHMT